MKSRMERYILVVVQIALAVVGLSTHSAFAQSASGPMIPYNPLFILGIGSGIFLALAAITVFVKAFWLRALLCGVVFGVSGLLLAQTA